MTVLAVTLHVLVGDGSDIACAGWRGGPHNPKPTGQIVIENTQQDFRGSCGLGEESGLC